MSHGRARGAQDMHRVDGERSLLHQSRLKRALPTRSWGVTLRRDPSGGGRNKARPAGETLTCFTTNTFLEGHALSCPRGIGTTDAPHDECFLLVVAHGRAHSLPGEARSVVTSLQPYPTSRTRGGGRHRGRPSNSRRKPTRRTGCRFTRLRRIGRRTPFGTPPASVHRLAPTAPLSRYCLPAGQNSPR